MRFSPSGLSCLRKEKFLKAIPYLKFRPDLNSIYRHTSGNWLCNNRENHKARSVTFNVEAFCRLAAEATGANAVTDMLKISESFNRVFLVRFDTGCEAIAKFPTSLAGPTHFATATEVATIDFLRRRLTLPIPRVFTWSSHAQSTDVGAEFILMEKAPGRLLSDVWGTIPESEQGVFAKTLGEFERKLLELQFTHYGSLYYKNDVPVPLRAPTLLEGISSQNELSSEFCIGPIARRDFWEAEREYMDIDRGPWRTAEEYMKAVPCREKEWIARFGTSHILDHPIRVLPGQGNREDHLSWLSEYITLIPFLVPPFEEQTRPVLWHPDLHASDIFINPSKPGDLSPAFPLSISSAVSWQGTWIGPAFLQLKAPSLYSVDDIPLSTELPFLKEDSDDLTESEKNETEEMRKRRLHSKLFETAAFPCSILAMKAREERLVLDELARETWKYGLLGFRVALSNLYGHWDEIAPKDSEKYPVHYSLDYLEDLISHSIVWARHLDMQDRLDREFNLGKYGYVEGDYNKFEEVKAAVEKKKLEYVNEGKDAEAKMVRSFLWPYRDTLHDQDVIPRLVLSEHIHRGL